MTKEQFLTELNLYLKTLPVLDRKDILSDYESHINAAIENGKTEEAAVADLGSPKSIAEELGVIVNGSTNLQTQDHGQKVGLNIFAFLGMFLLNLIFILGPVAGIFGVFIGLYAASIGCLFSPIGFIFNLITLDSPIALTFFFVLSAFSLGYLILIATNFWIKGFIRILQWYWSLNVRIVRGGY